MPQIGVDVSLDGTETMTGSVEDISGRVALLSILNAKLLGHDLCAELACGRHVALRFRGERREQCPMLRGTIVSSRQTGALTYVAVEVLDWDKLATYWQGQQLRDPPPPPDRRSR